MDKEIVDVGMYTTTDGLGSNNDQQLIKINNQLNLYLRYKFLKIRKYLDSCKKQSLKRITLLCLHKTAYTKNNSKLSNVIAMCSKLLRPTKPSHSEKNKTRKCQKIYFTVVICNEGVSQITLDRTLKSDGSIARFLVTPYILTS